MVADPVFDTERDSPEPVAPPSRESARALLRRGQFRTIYLAASVSELGDALQYIALMWFALEKAGPLGVVAVRLADSLPAFFFGLHGGLAADRWSRKRLMISADAARAVILIPVGVAGLTGTLPIWGLVAAAFLLEAANSYFIPAYGATVPAVVEKQNSQAAMALLSSTTQALSIGGWALAAGLLTFMPVSVFFGVNAATFALSGLILLRLREPKRAPLEDGSVHVREGISALMPRRALFTAVVVFAVAMTITTGSWIAGIPTISRDSLHEGASGFSLLMIGFAVGSIAVGAFLTRVHVQRKARASVLAWALYLPAYGLIAIAGSLPLAIVGSFFSGLGESSSWVLLNSAAQEEIPDAVLGRVLGVISLVHRGAHATGLLFVSPLFAIFSARPIFLVAALVLPVLAVVSAAITTRVAATAALP